MPKNEGSRPLFWLCGERPTRCSAERGGRIASGEIERPSQPLRSTKTYHRKGMRGIKRPVDKKFLSSSLCFIQMPPKTLKIVWTEPSHVRFKERSKLLASVKVYNELKTVWDLKGSSNKNQTVTFVFIVGKRWDHVILF